MMTKNEQLYRRVVEEHENSDADISLAKYIAERMEEVDDVKSRVAGIERNRRKEQQKFDSALIKLKCDHAKVQETCPHLSTTYNADAAGGSDSHTKCDHCKKVIFGSKGFP